MPLTVAFLICRTLTFELPAKVSLSLALLGVELLTA